MKGLRGGTYWPVVFFDFDGNGIFTPDWDGSPTILAEAGFYDADWDLKPDSIVVADSNLVDIQIFFFGVGTESQPDLPERAFLLPNYPNPFNPQTTLSFRLERPARIELSVHDLLGRKVATVAKGLYLTGLHEVIWQAVDLPSGLYATRLVGEGFILRRLMLLIK